MKNVVTNIIYLFTLYIKTRSEITFILIEQTNILLNRSPLNDSLVVKI